MNITDYARRELSAVFNNADLSNMSPADIRTGVDSVILGGWQRILSDYRAYAKSVTSPATPSPVQIRLAASKALGRDLREHDEVRQCDLTGDQHRVLVVAFATVEQRARFDHITGRTIQVNLWSLNPDTGKWDLSRIETHEDADEKHYHAGGINTPERDAEQREQVETCYRPGTPSAPMDGWVRRLEVSHKDVHPDVYAPKS